MRENVFEEAMEEFEMLQVEPERFIDGGDTVVVEGTFHCTTHAGERIESPFAHVTKLRDGAITGFVNYTDTALWP